jgi:nucleotide-binding universal stress UspA family protein
MGERLGVVVGIDGSEGSREALAFALEEAARRGTGVRVISVFLPPQYRPEAYSLAAPPTVDQVKDDLRMIATRMIDHVVAEHPGLAAVPVELHELEGHPAEVLIDRARGAALLVVGHRGRGGFASALLGSVGMQCVLHGECPVTVVRTAPRPETPRAGLEHSAERTMRAAAPPSAQS